MMIQPVLREKRPEGSSLTGTVMNNTKYNSLDYNRCVLIVMVILCHVVKLGELYPDFQDAVLMIVNPAFLMITGYLVRVDKGWKDFSLYLVRIILPYVIMTLGFGVLSVYLPVRYGLADCRPSTLLHVLLVEPIGPYWYFHTMIICSFLYYIAFKSGRLGKLSSFFVFASLLIVCSKFLHLMSIRFAFSFFMGACIRQFCGRFHDFCRPSYYAVIPFVLLLAKDPVTWSDFVVIVLSFCFVSFFSQVFAGREGRDMDIMGYIGRNTFPIYIFHPIFTMAAKFVSGWFVFDKSGVLYTVFTVVLCVSGSLGIARLMDMTRLSRCFGRKRMLR